MSSFSTNSLLAVKTGVVRYKTKPLSKLPVIDEKYELIEEKNGLDINYTTKSILFSADLLRRRRYSTSFCLGLYYEICKLNLIFHEIYSAKKCINTIKSMDNKN